MIEITVEEILSGTYYILVENDHDIQRLKQLGIINQGIEWTLKKYCIPIVMERRANRRGNTRAASYLFRGVEECLKEGKWLIRCGNIVLEKEERDFSNSLIAENRQLKRQLDKLSKEKNEIEECLNKRIDILHRLKDSLIDQIIELETTKKKKESELLTEPIWRLSDSMQRKIIDLIKEIGAGANE